MSVIWSVEVMFVCMGAGGDLQNHTHRSSGSPEVIIDIPAKTSAMKITQALTGGSQVHGGPDGEDRKITLNVGGVRHDTWSSTLERFPGTRLALLAHLQETDESYDIDTGEYFFDRHAKAFESILNYYRTGELHVDQSMCGNILKMELDFWGIEEHEIEACCWADYSKYTEHKDTLRNLDDNFAFVDEDEWAMSSSKYRQVAARVWRFLEEPGSSRWAKVYAVTSMFFVALSIAIFVLETHKLFQVDANSGISMSILRPEEEITPTGSKNQYCCGAASNQTDDNYIPVAHPALRFLDYICVVFFTLELLVRFVFCPNKWRFFRAPLNLIDLVCLIPHYTSIILAAVSPSSSAAPLIKTIMMLRIIRILRIFKLMKHYNAFKILVYTIKVSTKELFLMIVFLMSGVLMFASIIHYTEQENFPNIPIGIWWALVTMTTVGYGDKYPVGYIGYVMGSVCVICGVLVIAFTVPIVVNNFSLYYSHAQTRIKVPSKRPKQKRLLKNEVIKRFKSTPITTQPHPGSISTISDNVHMPSTKDKFVQGFVKKLKHPIKHEHKSNNLNISPPDNSEVVEHTDIDIDTTTPRANKNTARKVTSHGNVNNPSMVTPIETNEDVNSVDSGFDGDIHKTKKHIEETQRLMQSMAEADERLDTERKRQEWLIQKKRQERSKLLAQKEEASSQEQTQPSERKKRKQKDVMKEKEEQ